MMDLPKNLLNLSQSLKSEKQSEDLNDKDKIPVPRKNKNKQAKEKEKENKKDEEEEEEETFEVEKILDYRVKHKKLQFYLRWSGWTEEDDTWEDFDNLNCPDKIRDFRNSILKEKGIDVLAFLSTGQRLIMQELFKDDPDFYKDIDFSAGKKCKRTSGYIKKSDRILPENAKDIPFLSSNVPKFETIAPDYQTSNPLESIEGISVKDGEIFYIVKRRKLPIEKVPSNILQKAYPEFLVTFLNDLFTGNNDTNF